MDGMVMVNGDQKPKRRRTRKPAADNADNADLA
jgi:hypothetical protein